MDPTYTDLIRGCAQHTLPDRPTLLVTLLTLARPHELLDHRTYVRNGNLSICGTREIPLGAAAAQVLGGDGPTSERLPQLEPDSLAGCSADQIAAAAMAAVLEAARTSRERRAVLAYCGRIDADGDPDLKLAADLIDDLTRQAGFQLTAPRGRHLRAVD
jgi:hypothetical protein